MSAKAAIWIRGGRGAIAAKRRGPPPAPKLILYEYEGSPWCRRVREHACSLDLQLHIRPCPREAFLAHVGPPFQSEGYCGPLSRFRSEVKELGGSLYFPFLVDETAGVVMNESSQIVHHLWKNYADNVLPEWPRPISSYNLALLSNLSNILKLNNILEDQVCLSPPSSRIWRLLDVPSLVASCLLRPMPRNGVMLRPARDRKEQGSISLHGHEGCAETRLVRETLSCLQLPYILIPTATVGGSRSSFMAARAGGEETAGNSCTSTASGIPVLVDGDKELHGACAAIEHLERSYALGPPLSYFAAAAR
jgi:glutathione S-transferase